MKWETPDKKLPSMDGKYIVELDNTDLVRIHFNDHADCRPYWMKHVKRWLDESESLPGKEDEVRKLLKEVADIPAIEHNQDLYWRIQGFLYPYGEADFESPTTKVK